MAEENKPDKGISVGEVTDIESTDVTDDADDPDLEDDDTDGDDDDSDDSDDGDDGDDDDTDGDSGNDPDDQSQIDEVLSGGSVSTTALQTIEGEGPKQEDGVVHKGTFRSDVADVREDGKMVISLFRVGCYVCPLLRPGVPSKIAGDDDPPCSYLKGNPACPAEDFQLTVISKYEKITTQLASKMKKAKDAPGRMAVLKVFYEEMADAPPSWMEKGLEKLKPFM